MINLLVILLIFLLDFILFYLSTTTLFTHTLINFILFIIAIFVLFIGCDKIEKYKKNNGNFYQGTY